MKFTKKQINAINKISVNRQFSGAWKADGYLCVMCETMGLRIHEEFAPTEGIIMAQTPVMTNLNRIMDGYMNGSEHDYYRVDTVTAAKLKEIKEAIRSAAPKFNLKYRFLVMLVFRGKPYICFDGNMLLKMFDAMPKDCNVFIDRKGEWKQPALFCDEDFNMHGIVLPFRETEEDFNNLYQPYCIDPAIAMIEIELDD